MTIDVREMTLYDHELRKRELRGPGNNLPGLKSFLVGLVLILMSYLSRFFTESFNPGESSRFTFFTLLVCGGALMIYGEILILQYLKTRRDAAAAHQAIIEAQVNESIDRASVIIRAIYRQESGRSQELGWERLQAHVETVKSFGTHEQITRLSETLDTYGDGEIRSFLL